LELVDGNDQVLATGRTTAANLDSVINNFVAPEAGTYYVRVTGRPFRDYNLVVTRGADFDTEDNGTQPQSIADVASRDGVHYGLGHVGALVPADADRYSLPLTEGQTLTLQTYTPGDQGGAFGNTLDPMLRLFNPTSTQVAEDDDSAPDGRNAFLSY